VSVFLDGLVVPACFDPEIVAKRLVNLLRSMLRERRSEVVAADDRSLGAIDRGLTSPMDKIDRAVVIPGSGGCSIRRVWTTMMDQLLSDVGNGMKPSRAAAFAVLYRIGAPRG